MTSGWAVLAAAAATLAIPAGILAAELTAAPGAVAGGPNEDDPGWSCVDDGNRICGPGNDNGVAPGCYDDGGVLEFPWPCTAWRPSYGYLHGDGTITYPNGEVYCPADGEIYGSAADCTAQDKRPAVSQGNAIACPVPVRRVTR